MHPSSLSYQVIHGVTLQDTHQLHPRYMPPYYTQSHAPTHSLTPFMTHSTNLTRRCWACTSGRASTPSPPRCGSSRAGFPSTQVRACKGCRLRGAGMDGCIDPQRTYGALARLYGAARPLPLHYPLYLSTMQGGCGATAGWCTSPCATSTAPGKPALFSSVYHAPIMAAITDLVVFSPCCLLAHARTHPHPHTSHSLSPQPQL